jgi:hypothetical protein
MAAEATRQPHPLRRWLQKLRESWRRSAAMSDCAGAARRAHDAKAEKYGVNRSIDPGAGPFGGF